MTSRDLVAELRLLGPQDQNVIFAFIADHLYECRLNTGARLNDAMDFKLFLHEVSEAWRVAEFPEGTVFPPSTKVHLAADSGTRPKVTRRDLPAPHPRWNDSTCPRCGHVHEGVGECGVSMGKDRICRCELEVSA